MGKEELLAVNEMHDLMEGSVVILVLQEIFFALSPGQAGPVSRAHHLCTSNPIVQPAFHIQRMLKQMKSSKQLTAKWFCAVLVLVRHDRGLSSRLGKPCTDPALQWEQVQSARWSLVLVKARRHCTGNSAAVAVLTMEKI